MPASKLAGKDQAGIDFSKATTSALKQYEAVVNSYHVYNYHIPIHFNLKTWTYVRLYKADFGFTLTT